MLMEWSCWSYFFFTLVPWYVCCCEQTFGTRSNYGTVSGLKQILEVPGCKAHQLWVLSRAGGSWPPESTFQRFSRLRQLGADIVTNHQEGRGTLPSEVIERFKTLNFPPEEVEAGTLTEKGKDYFKNLGHTLKETFPHLFSKPFSTDNYEIRYIDSLSSYQSMESFTRAIFGEEFDTSTIHKPAELDTLLDAPNICLLWKTEAYKKNYWRILTQTITSPQSRLTREVSKRLGFNKYLDNDTVILMYLGCCLQHETDPLAPSTWCEVFSPDNIKLIEYLEDQFYYKACTGGENRVLKDLDNRMPCRLYQELIPQLSRVEHKRLHPDGLFYFTDEKTLLLLLNGLGFIKESSITDFNTAEERTFRTSELVPLGANLLIVIYRCSKEELKIAFSLNGKLLKLPEQEDNLFPLTKFKKDLNTFSSIKMECHGDFCRDIDKTKEDITKVFLNT